MTTHAKTVFEDAMMLPDEDRAELVRKLVVTLNPREHDDDAADPGVEAAWDAELERRIAEMDSGKVKGIDAFEMIAEIKAGLK